ncbi:uncharacterized protein [Embiotoca jacksoni]|uniref:uncharacterized protein n=1 Tax=Embiotoca jacksoni TaxID=100190 RepID=UPI003703B056
MEAFYKVQLQKAGLAEMEKFYKQKLQKERSALKDKVEELKSFKDRMAGEVALPIKTGNSESMNSPVIETRLKEMYEELWQEWPKIKPLAESECPDVDRVTRHIQDKFRQAAAKMKEKMKLIATVFELEEQITGPTSQKVTQYRRLTVQNLQLVLYHSRRGDAAQTEHEDDKTLQCFLSRCYWLAGLMALNNPPLQPDWESHRPGMGCWNIFPRNLRAASAL